MAEVRDCPRCGTVCPPETRRCDCGYDFVLKARNLPPDVPLPGFREVYWLLLLGPLCAGLVVIGLGVLGNAVLDGFPREQLGQGLAFLVVGSVLCLLLAAVVRGRHRQRIRNQTRP